MKEGVHIVRDAERAAGAFGRLNRFEDAAFELHPRLSGLPHLMTAPSTPSSSA